MPFRTSSLVAFVAMFVVAALTGCGGGAGMTGVPLGAPDAGSLPVGQVETGGLRFTLKASDLGIVPSRGGVPDPLVVHLWLQGPEQSELLGPQTKELADEVSFEVNGLRPVTWHINVWVRRGWLIDSEPVVARGLAAVQVEANVITSVFVPMELIAAPPTTGGISVSAGTVISVPNGTEINRNDTFELTVSAPRAWIGQGEDRRAMVQLFQSDAPDGDHIRSWDNWLELTDFVGLPGFDPDVYWTGGGNLGEGTIPHTVYLRAGEQITFRWPLHPAPYITHLVLTMQVGTKGVNEWGNPTFQSEPTDGHLEAAYPLIL